MSALPQHSQAQGLVPRKDRLPKVTSEVTKEGLEPRAPGPQPGSSPGITAAFRGQGPWLRGTEQSVSRRIPQRARGQPHVESPDPSPPTQEAFLIFITGVQLSNSGPGDSNNYSYHS